MIKTLILDHTYAYCVCGAGTQLQFSCGASGVIRKMASAVLELNAASLRLLPISKINEATRDKINAQSLGSINISSRLTG